MTEKEKGQEEWKKGGEVVEGGRRGQHRENEDENDR